MQHNRIIKRRRSPPVEREELVAEARQLATHSRVPDTSSVDASTEDPFSATKVTVSKTIGEPTATVTTPSTTSKTTSKTSSAVSTTSKSTVSQSSSSSDTTAAGSATSVVPDPSSSDTSPSSSVPLTSVTSTSTSVPATGATSGSISSGAIAGVVIAVLIAVLGLGLFLCVYRRRRGKQVRNPRWMQTMGSQFPPAQESSPFTDSPRMRENGQITPQLGLNLAQPPVSYGNATPVQTTYSPASVAGEPPASAKVKLTFVPTLPDELSITHGEQLKILHDYDDGWALCVNSSGSQGMVPMECLQMTDANQGLRSPRLPVISERRASSLAGDGRY